MRCPPAVLSVLGLTLAGIVATPLNAQPNQASITVTPDNSFHLDPTPRLEHTSGHTVSFTVTNIGSGPDDARVRFTCAVSGSVDSVTSCPLTTFIPPNGGVDTVTVTVQMGFAGPGFVTLTATPTAPGPTGPAGIGRWDFDVRDAVATWSPATLTATLARGAAGNHPFTLQNTGTLATTFSLQALCSPGTTSCATAPTTTGSLAPSAMSSVTVSYTTVFAATSSVFVNAIHGPETVASATITVNVVDATWSPTTASTTVAPSTTSTFSGFTLSNPSGGPAATFDLSFTTCTGVSSCRFANGQPTATQALAVNGSAAVPITFDSPASGTGTVTVRSSYGGVTLSTATLSVTVLTTPTVSVLPDGGALVRPPSTASSQTFTVTHGGPVPSTYNLTAACTTPGATGCPALSPITFNAAGPQNVVVNFTSGGVGTTGRVTLTATHSTQTTVTDNGFIDVKVVNVTVVPVAPTIVAPANATGQVAAFTVTNTGPIAATFDFTGVCAGIAVSTCQASPTQLPNLAINTPTTVNVTYNTGASGTGTVSLQATFATVVIATGVSNVTIGGSSSAPNPSVTPDNGSATNLVPGSLQTSAFTVTNTGTTSGIFEFTAACRGTAIPRGCTISPAAATIAGLGNTPVTVQWTAGGAGTNGRVILSATWKGDVKVTDDGSINVSTQAPASPTTTAITTAGENPGANLPRDLCLTVGLSRNVSSECGDLRMTHLFPMVRTVNKVRMPALIYNSGTAHPYPTVIVTLTRATGSAAFDSVEGILRVNGVQKRRASWTGASLPAGTARQLVLSYDALSDPTGIYYDTVQVSGFIGGVKQPTMTSSGRLVIVNRSASLYGVGWWVAGLEQLFTQSDSSRLWVGGDGSSRRFAKVNSTTFIAEGPEFPDTVKYTATPTPKFTRYLPGGTKVEFDNTGKHTATVNRLGYATTMTYLGTGATTRLQTIAVPPAGNGVAYTFVYDGSNRLDSVAAPLMGARSRGVNVTLLADGRIQTIRDPDNQSVSFGYDATLTRLMTSRTDKRATVTSVTYDSARKVSQATIAMAGPPNIVYAVRNRQTQGLNLAAAQAGLVDTAVAYTHLNGPRTDVADTTVIWLDRFGSPRRVRNALGHQSVIERSDSRFAGLVTATMALNGLWRRGGYDARGNLTRDTLFNPYGTGANPVTQFTWHQTWDAPTQITRPLGDGVTMTYDPANGNRLTQFDGRGTTTTITFRYGATGLPGLLTSIVYPVTRTGETDLDSLAYGSLQNLEHLRTATVIGAATTVSTARHFTNDNIGQTSSACIDLLPGAGQQCAATQYDILSRDSVVTETGPAGVINPAQTLTINHFYDAEGNRTRLDRSSVPDIGQTPIGLLTTQWGYDRAHRPVVEIAPDGALDSTFFSAAGTVDSVATRRGHRIRMTYNVLNQLTQKVLPAVSYATEHIGLAAVPTPPTNDPDYPRLFLDGVSSNTIQADTHIFSYDSLGNVVTANNGDAQISRTYWPGGALRVETQRVRTYAGTDFTQHVYPVGYRYDLNGRLETLRAPVLLTSTPSGTRDSVRFAYLAGLGALQTVSDPLGNPFSVGYDNRQQLNTLAMPGSINEAFKYDGPGRVVQDSIQNLTTTGNRFTFNPLRKTIFGYEGRDKMTRIFNTAGAKDTLQTNYSGLGQVEKTAYTDHGTSVFNMAQSFTSIEIFKYDAMGNVDTSNTATTGSSGPAWETWTGGRKVKYYAGNGRVQFNQPATAQIDSLGYDAAGNQHVLTFKGSLPATASDRLSYFDAEHRLRVVDYRTYQAGGPGPKPIVSTFEEYRYDAFGRRVFVRTRRACNVQSATSLDCGIHVVRRTVWHGNQELIEIQMPGADSVATVTLENDSAAVRHEKVYGSVPGEWLVDPNPFYGRVFYTPGLVIDQPLAVTRWELQDSVQALNQFERYPSPFTIVPHWNARGLADMGTFASGDRQLCGQSTIPANCLQVLWPFGWTVYQQRTYGKPLVWHGTILDQKREGSALLFRRNRFLDPSGGRFSQEDPIGLAGGINAYGFGDGDPVNFSDPFGLKVCFAAFGRSQLVEALSDAIGTSIEVDESGCITDIGSGGNLELRARLQALQDSPQIYSVEMIVHPFDLPLSRSGYNTNLRTAFVGREVASRTHSTRFRGIIGCTGRSNYTMGSAITHELLGHGYYQHRFGMVPDTKVGVRTAETYAIIAEDVYYAARPGTPLRPPQCHD